MRMAPSFLLTCISAGILCIAQGRFLQRGNVHRSRRKLHLPLQQTEAQIPLSFMRLVSVHLTSRLVRYDGPACWLLVPLPASACHTSDCPHSSGDLHRAASAGLCWCPWAQLHWCRPDITDTGTSQSYLVSPCWWNLKRKVTRKRCTLSASTSGMTSRMEKILKCITWLLGVKY